MSTIQTSSISNQAGTGPVDLEFQSAAKAWVRIQYQAINNSLNISSLTDNGVGWYNLSLTNSFAVEDYAGAASGHGNNSSERVSTFGSGSNSSVSSVDASVRSNGSLSDSFSYGAVWGDLA